MKITKIIAQFLSVLFNLLCMFIFFSLYRYENKSWFFVVMALIFCYYALNNMKEMLDLIGDSFKDSGRYYTGCKDRNGTKIYADDCLIDKWGVVDTVEYRQGVWRFGKRDSFLSAQCKHYEVIGNVKK